MIASWSVTSEAKRMVTENTTTPRRLTEREAAAYLGAVSVRTLQDWRRRKIGPVYSKLGKRVAYDIADLDLFIEINRVEPKQWPAGVPHAP